MATFVNPYNSEFMDEQISARSKAYVEMEKQRLLKQMEFKVYQDLGQARMMSGTTTEMGDTIIYDHNTMTYKTSNQEKKIKELEKQIEEKEIKKGKNLKDLIAYYYRK